MNRLCASAAAFLALTGCVQTDQLYAVHDLSQPFDAARDDQPRVNIQNEVAKPSFVAFLSTSCGGLSRPKWQIAPKTNGDDNSEASTWAATNPKSAVCSARIAAYAIDQCRYMTLRFNKVTLTTKVLVQAFSVAAALTTDSIALAHPNATDKTATAALAVAIAGNASNIAGIGDPLTVSPADMIAAAPTVGEAIGLDDDADFTKSTATPSESGQNKFARLHDAVLSMCAANLIGARHITKR